MKKVLLASAALMLAACADATSPTVASKDIVPRMTLDPGVNTVVVREADITRQAHNSIPTDTWVLFNRDAGTGSFISGPGTAPLGFGSVQLSTAGTNDKAYLFNYDHIGTSLADISAISYSTYITSPGSDVRQAPALNIQIDKNGGTLEPGDFSTLVFEPVYNTDQAAVALGVWQNWDAYDGGSSRWWMTGTSPCPAAAVMCTWSDVLSSFPNATIVGGFGINQGGGNAGLVGSVDALSVAYGGNSVTYDFEDSACHFTDVGSTRNLEGNCETTTTVLIPNGMTLDGNGYTITAKDPAGNHFRGAVIRNDGTTASVINLTVTASGLVDACDGGNDRLRGILFEGASGTISGNTVTGVRQGLSGCQEGNAIEARNSPFAGETGSVTVGPDVNVTISNNTVTNYQKNGITANGAVVAVITGNIVTGDGPITYTAQNGIQVAFGATATVKSNTVTGNNYTPTSYEACGLLLYRADGVKSSSNSVFDNEKNQCNYGKGSGNVRASN